MVLAGLESLTEQYVGADPKEVFYEGAKRQVELKLKSETTRQQKNQEGKYVKTMRLKSGAVKAVAKSQIQPTNVLKSCLQQHSFEKKF